MFENTKSDKEPPARVLSLPLSDRHTLTDTQGRETKHRYKMDFHSSTYRSAIKSICCRRNVSMVRIWQFIVYLDHMLLDEAIHLLWDEDRHAWGPSNCLSCYTSSWTKTPEHIKSNSIHRLLDLPSTYSYELEGAMSPVKYGTSH